MVSQIAYEYGCRTDHSLVVMEIKNNERKRSPGIWKLNTTLLNNKELQDKIREKIMQAKENCKIAKMKACKSREYVKGECTMTCQEFSHKQGLRKRNLLNDLYLCKEIQQEENLAGYETPIEQQIVKK